MTRSRFLRLGCDRSGTATIEFAVVAPLLFTMLFGVLQVGVYMHDYNSLRSASADIARYALVNYQAKNKLNDTQLSSYARSVAVRSPYLLADARLKAIVTTPATQRIAGATEKTVTLTYSEKTILPFIDVPDFQIRFTRPVFLLSA